MATELAKAYVQIIPSAEGIQGQIADALSGEADSAGKSGGRKYASGFGAMTKKALVGLGIGKIIKDAIGDASAFETSMAKTSTLFTGTAEQFDALQSKILELSSAYGLGATTLAEAAYSAESASVPMEDLGAMLESSAKLATAGFTDIDTALSATAKTMNAYGITGEDAMESVQKILMQTQNLGITTVGELGASLANVTPTAAAMGVSFEQVGAAMAQMTAQGVPTAQATTQLRSAMTELGKEGTKADKAFREAAKGTKYANMSFKEAISKGANLGDVFGMMQKYADKSGKSMVDLWGSVEAGNAAMMIASDLETFNKDLEQMATSADIVDEAYGKMANTFGNSMNRLKESAKNFMTALFTGGDISASFDAMLESLGDIGAKLTDWLTNGLKGLGESLPDMMESLLKFGEGLLDALGNVDWISIGTTIINGIIGALGTLGTHLMELFSDAVNSLVNGDVDFASIGQSIWDGATSILGTLGETLKTLFGGAVDALLGENGILNSFASLGEKILDAVSGALGGEDGNFLSKTFTQAESDINGIDWEALGDNVAKAGAALVNMTGEALAGGFTAAYEIIDTIDWETLGQTIGNIANGLINLTGEVLSSAFTAAYEAINTIDWAGLGETIGNIANGLINLTDTTLSSAFTAAYSTINSIDWSGLGETIGNIANGLINLTDEALSGVFTAAYSTISSIGWDALGTTIGNIANGLISLTDEAMSGAFTAAHSTIKAIDWAGLGTTIGGIADALTKASGETLAAPFKAAYGILIGIKWENVGSAIQTGLGEVWEGLTGFLGGTLKGAGEAAEGIGTWIKNQLTGGDQSAVQALQEAIRDLNTALEEGKTTLETSAKNIGACIRNGIEDELTTTNMNKIGSQALEDIMAGATESEGDLDTKMAEIAKAAAEKFADSGTWNSGGKDAINYLKEGVEGAKEDLTSSVTGIMDTIITEIKGKDWTGTGNEISKNISSGIKSQSDIEDAAKQKAAAAQSAFTSVGWSSVGSNIVKGIVTGVNASASTLTAKMKSLALQALEAAKNALGISSPSKVMKEGVGQWIPEGIALGIEQNKGIISDAMTDLSSEIASVDMVDAAVSQGASLGEAAGQVEQSGSVTGDIIAAIQGMRNDLRNLKLIVDKKVFGEAVVDYGGEGMKDYIGSADIREAFGYGS